MKKIVSLNLLLLLFTPIIAFSQEYAVDKQSVMFSVLGSFSSAGSDLFKDSGHSRRKTIDVSSVANIFILKNIFVGGGLTFTNVDQGNENSSSTSVGPQIGYAFGDAKSTIYPYVASGIGFRVIDDVPFDSQGAFVRSQKGIDIKIGAGVIVPVKKYIGINVELDYHRTDLKRKSEDKFTSGNSFNIAFGITGLLY